MATLLPVKKKQSKSKKSKEITKLKGLKRKNEWN